MTRSMCTGKDSGLYLSKIRISLDYRLYSRLAIFRISGLDIQIEFLDQRHRIHILLRHRGQQTISNLINFKALAVIYSQNRWKGQVASYPTLLNNGGFLSTLMRRAEIGFGSNAETITLAHIEIRQPPLVKWIICSDFFAVICLSMLWILVASTWKYWSHWASCSSQI